MEELIDVSNNTKLPRHKIGSNFNSLCAMIDRTVFHVQMNKFFKAFHENVFSCSSFSLSSINIKRNYFNFESFILTINS